MKGKAIKINEGECYIIDIPETGSEGLMKEIPDKAFLWLDDQIKKLTAENEALKQCLTDDEIGSVFLALENKGVVR